MNKIMLNKILSLSLVVGALCLNAFAQEKSADKMSADKSDKMTAGRTVSAAEAVKTALNVGAKMPAFNLKDANGKSVSSEDLLKQGNLVVVFYRGSWCPFCNTYLRIYRKI